MMALLRLFGQKVCVWLFISSELPSHLRFVKGFSELFEHHVQCAAW